MGVGLVGAFAAREVFVSTMGIVYSVGDASEETTDLEGAMQSDTLPRRPPRLDAAGRGQPAGLVRPGDAVHEHPGHRQPRDRRLALADAHAACT